MFSLVNPKKIILAFVLGLIACAMSFAQSTSFTYQGKLTDNAMAASGTYQMQFALFDASNTQVGATVTNSTVQVSNGIFTVTLDFGPGAFSGAARFLQVGIFSTATNAFVPLTPRQPVTSSPYAVRSLNAATADSSTDSTQLGGIAASQYVLTDDPRLLQLPGNAIQNSTTLQSSANFNISGSGGADSFDAATDYKLAGKQVLSIAGTGNTFAGAAAGVFGDNDQNDSFFGAGAGQNNILHGIHFGTGNNAFFGSFAGQSNDNGFYNAFFGSQAGQQNINGNYNAFFGQAAGRDNTSGAVNSFFGGGTGMKNTSGQQNSFFGAGTGGENLTGSGNSLYGFQTGTSNNSGNRNSFFGSGSGTFTTSGSYNTFIGEEAGRTNITGSSNTVLGTSSDVLGTNLDHATAIGADSVVTANNTIALGRQDGTDKVVVYGLGSGGSTQLCRNPAGQISSCSSSLRYKKNINPFTSGLSMVKQLKPITFDWKEDGMHDLGLGAEDVAKVNDLLVIHNDEGQVEGVKYDRIGVILINAVKEQQTQIELQNKLIADLQVRLAQVEKTERHPARARRRVANVSK